MPELSEQQAADLFVYFFAARYFEQPGDAKRGQRVFLGKRCGECHGVGSVLSPRHPASSGLESGEMSRVVETVLSRSSSEATLRELFLPCSR